MNGITLRADYGPYIVTAISPTQHFYTDTGLSSAVTLPAVITSTTTWYCAPAYSDFYTFTCTQLDGSDISPGVPQWVGTTADSTLNPRPSLGQLAADSAAPAVVYRSGEYYRVGPCTGATTAAFTVGYLRLFPAVFRNAVGMTKLGAAVSSAGGSGSVVRLGVYADSNGIPGSLLLDAGTIDGTSATYQEITLGSTLSLSAGLYWFGAAAQVGTQPTLRTNQYFADTRIPLSFGTSIPSISNLGGYFQSSVTGALPATFTYTAGNTPLAAETPFMFFKAA